MTQQTGTWVVLVGDRVVESYASREVAGWRAWLIGGMVHYCD